MIKRILIAASLLLSCLAPASAQFADQATFAGTGAGSINAQTVTLANVSQYSDLQGVIMKYIPGASGGTVNTTDATLNVNTLGAIHFRKPGPNGSGLITLTGSELVNGQGVWIMYDGTYFELLSGYTNSVGAANLSNSSLQFGVPVNLQLNASVGSNNLTIAVKGNNGSDPSATNPVLIPFRDVTIANGDPVILSLQASLSFTINSTNTMGCVSAQMCRLWIVAINNGGTVNLCAFNALSGTNVGPINEGVLQTSAAGTNGGSAAQTYYCNASAVTAKAIRIIGYVEIQEVTAGTWASGPTYVQLFGPGIKKPGEVFQSKYGSSASLAITPSSAANLVKGFLEVNVSLSTGATVTFTKTGASNVCSAQAIGGSGLTMAATAACQMLDVPNTTSSTTYTVTPSAGSGGSFSIVLDEIMG